MSLKVKECILLLLFNFCFVSMLSAQKNDRIVVSSMGTDVEYRISRTVRHHLKTKDYQVEKNVDSGQQILEILEGGPIKLWINYSHGDDHRIWGKDRITKESHYSNGLFMFDEDKKPLYPKGRSLVDLQKAIFNKEIQFEKGALIILHACAVATPHKETGFIFAQELANITGATVIAGQHKTEPLIEDYKELVYTNVKEFILFKPYAAPKLMGGKLYLTETMKAFLNDPDKYAFAEYDLRPVPQSMLESAIAKREETKAVRKIVLFKNTKQLETQTMKLELKPEMDFIPQ